MEEKELFQDYELNKWELSPRIYKIIGAAVAVHLFAFVVVGQFNLFGTKACDSPYVNKVCQVLDTAYMASVLLGKDMEFSSRDYEKTEIAEADITYIDVSQQFAYPAGYFDIANPAPPAGSDPLLTAPNGTAVIPQNYGTIPGIPDSFGSPQSLDPSKPAVLPTPNNNPIQGTLPSSPLGTQGNNPIAKTPRNFPSNRPKNFPPVKKSPKLSNESPGVLPGDEQTANKNNQPPTPKTDPAKEDETGLFNKKPLEDFGAKYSAAILNKEVNINAPFEIEIKAKLDKNGKLIRLDKNGKQVPLEVIVKEGSDPKMVEVAKEAISAFSDSQLLSTLYDAGVQNVTITFAQNQDNLMAIIKSEAPTENRANSIYSLVNTALQTFKLKEGSDEEALMKKAQFKTEGKNYIINFLIPNDEKTQMIEKNLKSLQEKQKKSDNDGVANTVNKDSVKGK